MSKRNSIHVAATERFRAVWRRLAKGSQCDALDSAEYRRVHLSWCNAGYPAEMRKFIIHHAKVSPGAFVVFASPLVPPGAHLVPADASISLPAVAGQDLEELPDPLPFPELPAVAGQDLEELPDPLPFPELPDVAGQDLEELPDPLPFLELPEVAGQDLEELPDPLPFPELPDLAANIPEGPFPPDESSRPAGDRRS